MSSSYDAENPFDDGEQTEEKAPNPFESDDDEAAKNPFDDDVEDLQHKSPAAPPALPAKQPEVVAPPQLPAKQPTVVPPPMLPQKNDREYNFAQSVREKEEFIADLNSPIEMTPSGLDRKEQELKRREQDIERREQKLHQKEVFLSKTRESNWPPFKPFLYHNIQEDMPTPEGVWLVRKAYAGWFATGVVMVFNFVTLLTALFITGGAGYIGGAIASFFYASLGIPLSFLIYRLLYEAVRRNKPSLYMLYMIFLVIEVAVYLVLAVGFGSYGGGGFLVMLDLFGDDSLVGGIISMVNVVFLLCRVGLSMYLWWVGRREYRKGGGLIKAKEEFTDAAKQGIEDNPELVMKASKGAAKASKKAAKKAAEYEKETV